MTAPIRHAGRSDDEVAAEVFDLLGEGVFEHIGKCYSWNES